MKKLIALVFVLFMGLQCLAQEYSTFRLDNGQTVIIKEVHDNPIVIVDTWIKTGSINETDKNNGVAHFLEHLFFKGTSKHPTGDFDKILESKGAITNAATSKDYTHYYILIPSNYFRLALDLHSDMLLNPQIPRNELEKERKVVLEEISKNNDNPNVVLFRNLNELLYKTHPYKREVIGKSEIIENITREEILNFYNTWYKPENMVTVIIGDVNTNDALNAVKKEFSLPASKAKTLVPKTCYKLDNPPQKQVSTSAKFPVQSAYILIGYKGAKNMEMKDSYALDVLATVLGDGKTSRLYQNLKERKKLALSIDAGNSSMKEDGIFYVSANCNPENVEELKKAVFEEISNLKTKEISQEELQKAKTIIERDTLYSRESISNIANEVGYTMVLTGDPKYYENYVANIKKVTPCEIKEVAQKYLDSNRAAISVVLPEEYKEGAAPQKAEKIKSCDAKVISQKDTTTKYLLQNGATLLSNKNTANDIIAINIIIKGGSYNESIPGLGDITAQTMLKGTQKYPREAFQQALEESGIKISPSQSNESFVINAKCTKNQLPLMEELLKEIVQNATLEPYDIDQVKKDTLFYIKKNRDEPFSLAIEEFKSAIWEGTAFGNTGKIKEKTIPKITQKDVKTYYESVFNPSNMVISINGNTDNQQIIDFFTNLFAQKAEKPVKYSDYSSQFKPIETNKNINIKSNTQTSWVILGWPTDGLTNQKDWATLQVIDSMLGTGMSSRLFKELREQRGLAYQVGSSYSGYYNKGAFITYIGTNPKTTKVAEEQMLNEINKLKKEFVSEKELKEAKDKLIGNYILSMETNMEKASTIGWFEASDRGYDFTEKYKNIINSVTINDVITVANKYFSKPYVITVLEPK